MASPLGFDERCVIVGAGAAGLCAAFAAREAGLTPLLLEREPSALGAWAHMADTVRCLSPRQYDLMPDGDSPHGPGERATAAEVAELLTRFQRRHRFRIQRATLLERVERHAPRGFRLHTTAGVLTTERLVIATGEFGVPRWPDLAGSFSGPYEHFRTFHIRSVGRGERVAVIGAGNSGADVALQLLAARADVFLSAPRPPERPAPAPPPLVRGLLHRVAGLPIAHLPGRGGCTDSTPVVDPGLFDAVRAGRITLVPRATRLTNAGLVDGAGLEWAVDRVVACTGFHRETTFLRGLVPLDDAGRPDRDARGPRARRDFDAGLVPMVPGLGFMGLPCMRTRQSGFLRGFAADGRAVIAGILRAGASP
ncbi:MAG: NAD(P)-binding domain-containing protein [Myxococcales bacterium]|nr:NAD(P)-binding domain-containing protein [Myxococcales bacterium]